MLRRLILILFITESQTLSNEGFVPPPQVLADVIQQAEKVHLEANHLMAGQLSNSFEMEERSSRNRGCLSQLLDDGQAKGCLQKQLLSPRKTDRNKADQIVVFVSFSMPEASLKSLFQEAQSHRAVLVMRGLYEDSFVKTAQKLQQLGMTIDINPELFEKHQITAVPTFLLIKEDHPVGSLKGNVTLDFVVKKFKDLTVKEAPCISLTP